MPKQAAVMSWVGFGKSVGKRETGEKNGRRGRVEQIVMEGQKPNKAGMVALDGWGRWGELV